MQETVTCIWWLLLLHGSVLMITTKILSKRLSHHPLLWHITTTPHYDSLLRLVTTTRYYNSLLWVVTTTRHYDSSLRLVTTTRHYDSSLRLVTMTRYYDSLLCDTKNSTWPDSSVVTSVYRCLHTSLWYVSNVFGLGSHPIQKTSRLVLGHMFVYIW